MSYQAIVRVNGIEVTRHEGIWDAFAVPLPSGDRLDIEVEVVKNGGASFPVRDVASGFIPFVFHTFGGIYQDVELLWSAESPLAEPVPVASPPSVRVEGTRIVLSKADVKLSAQDKAKQWLESRAGAASVPQTPASTPRHDGTSDRGESHAYLRGVLTWGWYPEVGHTNPPETTIRREVDQIQSVGFNLVKFCLWIPSHRYLEILHERGMFAWIELPLWDPTADTEKQESMAEELERIVSQYRHHPNVVLWTIGCELHETTSARYRQRLYEMVKGLVLNGALVKDNSGGAEMYGGDLREYGDFNDFHPYCDTEFYPEVLDSLLNGPRADVPIVLGEFNDLDIHRDLARLLREAPYWTSADPALNDQGSRWQHDLPTFLPTSRFAPQPAEHRHEALQASSLGKARFIRKYVQESVRARDDIAGYVITGLRDTPISTAGFLDDWDTLRFSRDDLAPWNGPTCAFVIPTRRPPWVNGGNRPGWLDPFNHFSGRVFWRIGAHSEHELAGALEWDVLHFTWSGSTRPQGRVAFGTSVDIEVPAVTARQVGEITWDAASLGGHLLRVRFGDAENSWPLWVVPPYAASDFDGWCEEDPLRLLPDLKLPANSTSKASGEQSRLEPTKVISTRLQTSADQAILLLTGEGTLPMPFWRESAYEFNGGDFWDRSGYRDAWERFLPMSPDCALDMEALAAAYPEITWETLLNRIDVRTYAEHPILVRGDGGGRRVIATTLRPFGGLGCAPRGVTRNPSGCEFLRRLAAM